jgi:hypothetical protein
MKQKRNSFMSLCVELSNNFFRFITTITFLKEFIFFEVFAYPFRYYAVFCKPLVKACCAYTAASFTRHKQTTA